MLKDKLYENSPSQMKLAWSLLFDFLVDVYFIRGRNKNTSWNIYMVAVGKSPWVDYVFDSILDDIYEKKYRKKCSIFQILNSCCFKREDVNLVVIRINKFYGRFLEKKGFIKIPEWVDFEEKLFKYFGDNKYFRELENKAYLEKKGYSYQIRCSISDFNYFYYNMYLPYIKKRFKETAYIHSYTYLRRIFKKGALLFVFRESMVVSGLLYYVKHKKIYFNNIGVEKGDINLLKEGAVEAIYYFFIKMAKVKYASDYTINFGGARPFLNDGLFQYKKKWASQIVKRIQDPYNFYLLFRDNRYFSKFVKLYPFVSLE